MSFHRTLMIYLIKKPYVLFFFFYTANMFATGGVGSPWHDWRQTGQLLDFV